MVPFGQIEILIVMRMWVYFRRPFLCVGGALSPCGSRNLEGNPKWGWEANIKPMYIQISISDSFIIGVSLSTLYVQVHDCQLKNSIADPTHPLSFLNLHLLVRACGVATLLPSQSLFF